MIADWIAYELRNWGAWCRSGPPAGPPVQRMAGSAEGRFVSPSDMGDEDAPVQPIRPNRERAEVVHSVYLHRMDRRERRVCVLHYVQGHPERSIPKLARISADMHAASMLAVARMVGDAFRKDLHCATQQK